MITIQTKEWFDRVNGNTYFSAEAFLGMDKILSLPFQYGYNGARDTVERMLAKHFDSCAERWELRDLLRQNGIEISESKTKSLKRNLSKESFENFTPFLKPENLAKYAYYRMQNNVNVICNGEEYFIQAIVAPESLVLEFGHAYEPIEMCKTTELNWF